MTKSTSRLSEITSRYKMILNSPPKEDSSNPCNNSHLSWMLTQITTGKVEGTKSHRWLGFIQGIMTAKGMITVNTERELTREILVKEDKIWRKL